MSDSAFGEEMLQVYTNLATEIPGDKNLRLREAKELASAIMELGKMSYLCTQVSAQNKTPVECVAQEPVSDESARERGLDIPRSRADFMNLRLHFKLQQQAREREASDFVTPPLWFNATLAFLLVVLLILGTYFTHVGTRKSLSWVISENYADYIGAPCPCPCAER